MQSGVPGTCRQSPPSDARFCAYPDPTCPSPPAERWGILAGDGIAKICVAQELFDGGVDAPVVDAAVDGGPDAGPQPFAVRIGASGTETIVGFSPGSASYALAGGFIGTTNLGAGAINPAGGMNDQDAFVALYAAPSTHQWSNRYGGTSGDYAEAVVLDPAGSTIIAGQFQGMCRDPQHPAA
jgi:hypothetical protein